MGILQNKITSSPLVGNFISLATLQGVNYLLPLLTIPFLYNSLGAYYYGLINFAFAFIQYFIMLTDFGFGLSATRYIAKYVHDRDKVNYYLNSVILSRLLLLLVSMILFATCLFIIPSLKNEKIFFTLFFLQIIGNVLSPYWFFQGVEQMKFMTLLIVISKLVSILPLFFLIKKPEDYYIVPIFYALGSFISAFICLYLIHKLFNMKYFLTSFSSIKEVTKDSLNYFLSRISVSLFTNTNTFIIGLILGNTAVGYYSLADKIYQALTGIYQPLIGSIFPYMTKNKNIIFFKKIFIYSNGFNLLAILIFFFLSSTLLPIFFDNINELTVSTMNIFLLGCIISLPSTLMGYPFLAALGHPNFTNFSLIASSIFHACGILILLIFNKITITNIAWMVVITEAFLLIYRIYGIYKYKLIK